MERTRKATDGRLRWKHTGGGILRLRNGKMIRPGETFLALSNEVPTAFRDTIKQLDPTVEVEAVKVVYTAKKRGNSNWWDVVDAQGKVLNDKALKKAEAVELAEKLEG